MDAIGKVTASIASATQETTLALANANFDMSLIRIEAPPEYKLLGSALAKSKRNVAEDGPAHVTARRLGSLFRSILPETPNLIKAYGTRASEIAQSPVVNPKGTDADGPFKDYVGVDGTSIWAAATSGSAAIGHSHLDGARRRTEKRIQAKAATAEYFDLSETLSSKLELDQDQLASWDASARSWIRAANDSPVISGRQKTVRSILDHINTTVRNKQDLYTSVTEAWKLSLETMEKIITGSSYSIEDGSVVVALVSWHLYPDLIVLGSQAEDYFQNDELVEPGGCVTVGLRSHSLSLAEKSGVHWSLSLAHLRYYGALKTTSRSLTNTPSGNERFTREEFTLIFVGVIIARWRDEADVSVDDAVVFMRLAISKLFELFQAEHPEQLGSWTKACIAALDDYEADDENVKGLSKKFLNLGLRNQSLFNPISSRNSPPSPSSPTRTYFSLLGLDSIYFAKVLETKEDQQRFFMATMRRLTRTSAERYRPTRKMLILLERRVGTKPRKLFIVTRSELKDLNTVHPSQGPVIKCEQGEYYIADVKDSVKYDRSNNEHLWSNLPRPVQRYMKRHFSRQGAISPTKEQTALRLHKLVATSHFVLLETGHEWKIQTSLDTPPVQNHQEIDEYLRHAQLAKYELLNLIGKQAIGRALRLLSRLWDMYDHLPGSTIGPSILDCNLNRLTYNLDGFPYDRHRLGSMLNSRDVANLLKNKILSHTSHRGCAFKLLVTFDAGVDIQNVLFAGPSAHNWHNLVAVSTDDSLYINPASLGNMSPYHTTSLELRRVRGNVGRPGVSLIGWFTSGLETEWRQPRMDMWRVVNHNPFQGKLEDAFNSTSLHLNITGWSREFDFGGNNCVPNGVFMEAIVTAHDQGTWLGDINILFQESLQMNHAAGGPRCCRELGRAAYPHPVQPSVVMCHGNWQARITAAALSVKKGYRTLLFDGHGCWKCAFSHLRLMKLKEVKSQREQKAAQRRMTGGPSSDDDMSSSDSSEGEEEKETTSAPSPKPYEQSTNGGGGTANDENPKTPEKGEDDATLVGRDDSQNNLADSLARSTINELEHDSDLDTAGTSDYEDTGDSDEDEDEKLQSEMEGELKGLPYVPTVFIL
ncbi:hypothetical protein PG997_010624 [Apiospora hydei]|uniref:Uncharacterized protein n=1 Tax=Apiospora hydei TaxID=1337664 RepID=A0ABR1VGQ5_9PEZI